jgi:hypothetical protein
MLKEKILNKKSGILTYGLTPPKSNNESGKIAEIAQKQFERISSIDIDALIIYDVQDEAQRVAEERPFPFLPTIDPIIYSDKYMKELNVPKILYRCVGKYSEDELSQHIMSCGENDEFAVYVGASASNQEVKIRLTDAYKISQRINPNITFGGVVLPERHTKYGDEHLRVIEKVNNGCSFFVSQAIYNIEASKNFLSDYYYHCINNNIDMVPILFNFTPCGSEKTLDFMKWLGISIPKWLENDLKHSKDILDKSVNLTKDIFEELFAFGLEKGIPIGCSIESVSTRKVEIEASIQMVNDVKAIMDKKLK